MAAGLPTAAGAIPKPIKFLRSSNLLHLLPRPTCLTRSSHSSAPSLSRNCTVFHAPRRKKLLTVCFVLEDLKQSPHHVETETETAWQEDGPEDDAAAAARPDQISAPVSLAAERLARKRSERFTYLVAAVMSSFGITSMAVMAVYYRFAWQMEGEQVPMSEMFGTFALSVGAAVGMEFWARWAHRALWHASLWHMHESHHRPRDGPFELNDVFAIINAVPAIALLSYGFFHKGLVPGLCFGAGLGITVFGMAYMFVHDGLVHRRFPVGPIADVPYFRRVASAHQIHHSDKFNGVPYGLFLGPKFLVRERAETCCDAGARGSWRAGRAGEGDQPENQIVKGLGIVAGTGRPYLDLEFSIGVKSE